MISVFKKIYANLFHLGSIQVTNIVLQLLLMPLVISRVGIEANGLVLTALSLSGLLSILINYAGSQTIPVLLNDLHSPDQAMQHQIARHVSANLFIRFFVFCVLTLLVVLIYFSGWNFGIYLVLILPLLFSEVLNPHAFLLSLGKIHLFNYINVVSRLVALLLVWATLHRIEQAPWINAWLGMLLSLFYCGIWIGLIGKKMIVLGQWNTRTFLSLLFQHAHLVGGNLVVHLQQSIFLYGLGLMASPAVLGTYSVLDKLVSGARMAMVAFSNAIYPFAINTFSEGIENWVALRRKVNQFLWMLLLGVGIIVFIAAPVVAGWLTNNADQSLLADYIRWMSPIPLLIGLNALNVMELLMKKKFHLQFLVSIQLLIAALVASAIFLAPFYFNVASISSVFFVPYLPVYLIFMESITLFVYERNRHHSC